MLKILTFGILLLLNGCTFTCNPGPGISMPPFPNFEEYNLNPYIQV
jgi:hypothetical protein